MNYLRKDGGAPLQRIMALADDKGRREYGERIQAREVELGMLAPPSTPDQDVKIGPPARKIGNLYRLNGVTITHPSTAVPNQRQRKAINALEEFRADMSQEEEENEMYEEARRVAKIKKEEDEERPYRMGLLQRTDPEATEPAFLEDLEDDDTFVGAEMDEFVEGLLLESLDKPVATEERPLAPRMGSIELPGFDFSVPTLGTNDDDDNNLPLLEVISPSQSTISPSQSTDSWKSWKEVLWEVARTLKQLRQDSALTSDEEIQQVFKEAEEETERLLTEKREPEDRDGDVAMDGEEEVRGPAPAYQAPIKEMAKDGLYHRDPMEYQEYRADALEREVRSLEWKVLGNEGKMNEHVSATEGRLEAIEAYLKESNGGTEAQPACKRLTRDAQEIQGLRGRVQKLENRAHTATRETTALRGRVVEAEKGAKEVKELRRKVNGMNMFLASLEGEVMIWAKRATGAEARLEEQVQKLGLAAREVAAMRININGLIPRVGDLHEKMREVEYRLITTEEQNGWNDLKTRTVWMAALATTPAEKAICALNVRTTWNTAAAAYTRRANNPALPLPNSGHLLDHPLSTLSTQAVDQPIAST